MGWIQSTIFAKSSILNVWVGSKYVSDYLGAFSIINNPPGIKTSWRRLSVRPSDVAGTSQMEHPTTSRGTSPRRLSDTSPLSFIGTSWKHLKKTKQRRPISTSPRPLKQVSNETSNDISVVSHQDVSVVHIHDVPFLRLCDVSFKSQMKQPITLL